MLVVVLIVVPVVTVILLVSAGLLKPIMVYALSNRDYGIQACNKHHCKEGRSRGGGAPEMKY